MRLLRLGRVVRKLDRYLEYGAAMLILLLCFYMLVAHWLACIWYSIGRSDADNGVQYSWLWKLANITQSPYSYVWPNDTNTPELINGPSRKTMYVTALYFTMTCMTSVGFGNVAAETDNERIFTICMMIIAGKERSRGVRNGHFLRLRTKPCGMATFLNRGGENARFDFSITELGVLVVVLILKVLIKCDKRSPPDLCPVYTC